MVNWTTFDIIVLIIIFFLILFIIGLFVLFFYLRGQYKHTFIKHIVTGDKDFLQIDKAKEYTDKESGVTYWKLLKSKHIISRPPNNALQVTEKGHFAVEDLVYIRY